MCYSKEVQLITAAVILLSCYFYYLVYSARFANSPKKWLKPFLNYVVLGFFCIGMHQFFEFLSLVTNSQVIYKVGLVISISSTYFLLRSLEVLANKDIHSKIALWIIGAAAVCLLIIPMSFQAFSFYLKHESAYIWAALWLLLFIYWHICAFKLRAELKDDKSKKAIIVYLLSVADISFILSAAYALWGYSQFSVNVCTDSPSIWCTFFVIQAFFIPFFFSALPSIFNRPLNSTKQSWKKTITYLVIAIIILALLTLTLPFFKCLTWKFVFP
jgi:hypothetical protein